MKNIKKKYLVTLNMFFISLLLSNCSSTSTNKDTPKLSDLQIYSKGLAKNLNHQLKQKFRL